MEQTFLEKLKRVKPGDLLHIIKFILAFPIAMVYRLFRRDLWLLCDTENECRDNGFWLYKYLRENTSEDAVYAINRKSPDYARVKDLGPVIQYGSFRHWIYYLAASKKYQLPENGKTKRSHLLCAGGLRNPTEQAGVPAAWDHYGRS